MKVEIQAPVESPCDLLCGEIARAGFEVVTRPLGGLALPDSELLVVYGPPAGEINFPLGRSLPVIRVFSSVPHTGQAIEAFEYADAYLVEPVPAALFLAQARAVEARHRRRRGEGVEVEATQEREHMRAFLTALGLHLSQEIHSSLALLEQTSAGSQEQRSSGGQDRNAAVHESLRRAVALADLASTYAELLAPPPHMLARVDANAAFQHAVSALGETIEARGAIVRCSPLPAVLAGTRLLTIVFEQLLAKAIVFSRAAAPVVDVSASFDADSNQWLFAMRDQGQVRETDSRVAEQSAAAQASADLAVQVARKALELMQGRLWCEAKGKQGKTIYFCLPETRAL